MPFGQDDDQGFYLSGETESELATNPSRPSYNSGAANHDCILQLLSHQHNLAQQQQPPTYNLSALNHDYLLQQHRMEVSSVSPSIDQAPSSAALSGQQHFSPVTSPFSPFYGTASTDQLQSQAQSPFCSTASANLQSQSIALIDQQQYTQQPTQSSYQTASDNNSHAYSQYQDQSMLQSYLQYIGSLGIPAMAMNNQFLPSNENMSSYGHQHYGPITTQSQYPLQYSFYPSNNYVPATPNNNYYCQEVLPNSTHGDNSVHQEATYYPQSAETPTVVHDNNNLHSNNQSFIPNEYSAGPNEPGVYQNHT